jgi:hypothetical protein
MMILTKNLFIPAMCQPLDTVFFAYVVRLSIFIEVAQEIRLDNVYSDSEAGLLIKKKLRLKILSHSPFKSCD